MFSINDEKCIYLIKKNPLKCASIIKIINKNPQNMLQHEMKIVFFYTLGKNGYLYVYQLAIYLIILRNIKIIYEYELNPNHCI